MSDNLKSSFMSKNPIMWPHPLNSPTVAPSPSFLAIYQTLPFCSFFQKVPFDMDFIWKMKMKSSFFIWNIKKTCAARGSLLSFPTHPSPHQPTQRRNLTYQCFCTKNKKVDHSNKKLSLLLPKEQNKTKHNSIFSKCKKVNQLMHFIFTKSTK